MDWITAAMKLAQLSRHRIGNAFMLKFTYTVLSGLAVWPLAVSITTWSGGVIAAILIVSIVGFSLALSVFLAYHLCHVLVQLLEKPTFDQMDALAVDCSVLVVMWVIPVPHDVAEIKDLVA